MTSAVGRAASDGPGKEELAPADAAADHDLRRPRDRRVDEDRPVGGQAERSDSAVLHARERDSLVHRRERRRPRVQAAPHDTVHIGARRGQHHARRERTSPPRLPLTTTQLAETSRPRRSVRRTPRCRPERDRSRPRRPAPRRQDRARSSARTTGTASSSGCPSAGWAVRDPVACHSMTRSLFAGDEGLVSPPARSARQRRPRLRRTATASTAAPAAAAITTPGRSR